MAAANRIMLALSTKPLVLDGGTSTEIVRLGHGYIDKDPLWSARLLQANPDVILTAHKNFLLAGSHVVFTATYQASIYGFMQHLKLKEKEAQGLFQKAVLIARQACQEVHKETGAILGLVFGSLGPYGVKLHDASEYTGSYKADTNKQLLQDWHRPHIKQLVKAGVDLVAMETFPLQCEAEAVVELIEKEFPQTKISVSFSCKNGSETCGGDKFCDAIKCMNQSNNVVAMGINCTAPQYITSLLKSLSHLEIQKPLLVKPNSGELWKSTDGWQDSPADLDVHEMSSEWMAAGASWIGGCCRIYPADIKKLRQVLDPDFDRYGFS